MDKVNKSEKRKMKLKRKEGIDCIRSRFRQQTKDKGQEVCMMEEMH